MIVDIINNITGVIITVMTIDIITITIIEIIIIIDKGGGLSLKVTIRPEFPPTTHPSIRGFPSIIFSPLLLHFNYFTCILRYFMN